MPTFERISWRPSCILLGHVCELRYCEVQRTTRCHGVFRFSCFFPRSLSLPLLLGATDRVATWTRWGLAHLRFRSPVPDDGTCVQAPLTYDLSAQRRRLLCFPPPPRGHADQLTVA